MPVTTTPAQRIARMMREGARLVAIQPGQTSIDVTPDMIALLDVVQIDIIPLDKSRNLLETNDLRRVLATRVHFP